MYIFFITIVMITIMTIIKKQFSIFCYIFFDSWKHKYWHIFIIDRICSIVFYFFIFSLYFQFVTILTILPYTRNALILWNINIFSWLISTICIHTHFSSFLLFLNFFYFFLKRALWCHIDDKKIIHPHIRTMFFFRHEFMHKY